ncbi:unnamed protein product, partial [marine sediment metagenome]
HWLLQKFKGRDGWEDTTWEEWKKADLFALYLLCFECVAAAQPTGELTERLYQHNTACEALEHTSVRDCLPTIKQHRKAILDTPDEAIPSPEMLMLWDAFKQAVGNDDLIPEGFQEAETLRLNLQRLAEVPVAEAPASTAADAEEEGVELPRMTASIRT